MLLTLPAENAPLIVEATLLNARERLRPAAPLPIVLRPNVPPHILLTLVVEGTNQITRCGESVTLLAGDAMLLWPGEEFRAVLSPERAFRAINVVFDLASQARSGEDTPAQTTRDDALVNAANEPLLPEVVRAGEDTSELRRAMEACARAAASGRSALAQVEFASTLLALARLRLMRREAALSPPVRRALEQVRRHPELPYSRAAIAEVAGVSPSYLSHLIKHETGATLSSHVRHARVARARELIHETDLNFGEIARALDMDLPRFSRQFKQVTGLAPRDYARAARLDAFAEIVGSKAQSDK